MDFREVKIKGEVMYDGKILKVCRDTVLCPNGNEAYREIIKHNGGACVLAITNDNCVFLEEQFRYAYDEMLYELPAGKLELNEDPRLAAIREFEEETGYKPNNMELLGINYPTCGYSNEKIYLYYTDDFVETQTNLDEDEFLLVKKVPLSEVLQMIKDGKIKDGKTINAIMLYLLKKDKITL